METMLRSQEPGAPIFATIFIKSKLQYAGKFTVKQRCEQDMDLISKMPDSIRNYIVSFLSMEDAIRTSALSKQWRNVCSSLPRFDFSQDRFEKMTNGRYNFMDFVDQTICRHDGSSIESFSLRVNDEYLYEDDPRIISWITFAINHKVKDLSIDIPEFDSLPDCLFTCATLTYLCLWGVTLNIPAELKFPILKMFHLMSIRFEGINQTNQLVVNCPLLEILFFESCSWNNIDDLIIHALNLETLWLFPCCCAHNITVHCPHLRNSYSNGNPPDISSETLSSLDEASFSSPSPSVQITTLAQNVVDQRVSDIVMGLSNVVCLSLDHFWLEILSRNRGILSNQSLSFCCLKTLNVHVFAEESQVHFVAFLSQIYPNLKTLKICFMEQDEHTDILIVGGYWHQQKLADEDSLESLEKVTIENFEGSNDDFYLLRHLLEKAKILKKIDITCSKKLDEDEPYIRSLTEKIAQIIVVSPYVTTTICSLKESISRVNKYFDDLISQT